MCFIFDKIKADYCFSTWHNTFSNLLNSDYIENKTLLFLVKSFSHFVVLVITILILLLQVSSSARSTNEEFNAASC